MDARRGHHRAPASRRPPRRRRGTSDRLVGRTRRCPRRRARPDPVVLLGGRQQGRLSRSWVSTSARVGPDVARTRQNFRPETVMAGSGPGWTRPSSRRAWIVGLHRPRGRRSARYRSLRSAHARSATFHRRRTCGIGPCRRPVWQLAQAGAAPPASRSSVAPAECGCLSTSSRRAGWGSTRERSSAPNRCAVGTNWPSTADGSVVGPLVLTATPGRGPNHTVACAPTHGASAARSASAPRRASTRRSDRLRPARRD